MKYGLLAYIGRFQLLHNGQLSVIRDALEKADHLLIMVGSSNRSPDIRNPFSYVERRDMLLGALRELGLADRVTVTHMPDFVYGNGWFNLVLDRIDRTRTELGLQWDRVGLTGHDKDATSFYLKGFPSLAFEPQPLYAGLHSTDMRRALFTEGRVPDGATIDSVGQWLTEWTRSSEYTRLQDEFDFVTKYQKTYPTDRTYCTADALVTCNGKMAAIRRGKNPGKGMLALPGGFVEPGEGTVVAAIRELEEETTVVVPMCSLSDSGFFNAPMRDVRGNIATNAYRFDLEGECPSIEARDDASEALWMDIEEFMSDPARIFSDHWFIARQLLMR